MRLLDLFCCQGGASAGYVAAGFDVVGVDIAPQPRYPHKFVQGDALEYLAEHGHDFDAVHASPPCQDHSDLAHRVGKHDTGHLLDDTLRALNSFRGPWIVENVESAPMPGSLVLCGTEFGLSVVCNDGKRRWLRRHRQFASNLVLMGAGGCSCAGRPIAGVYGMGGEGPGTRGYKVARRNAYELLGVPWMTQTGAAQAIPPAYTRFIGEQLIDALEVREAVA